MPGRTQTQLVDEIRQMLEEEFPRAVSLWSIPADRLRSEIAYSRKTGDSHVTVKIPSYHEFTMSMTHAAALLRHFEGRRGY